MIGAGPRLGPPAFHLHCYWQLKMKNIFSYDCRDAVRSVVKKTLKDDFGIKVPKEKTAKVRVNCSLRPTRNMT